MASHPADDRLMWIGGKEAAAVSGQMLSVENPATGEMIFRVPRGREEDVSVAVAAARKAADDGPWPAMHPRERGVILRRAAAILRERGPQIAETETRSIGRPLREMTQQVGRAPDWLDYFASVAETQEGSVVPAAGTVLNYVRRVPLGVVGQITPWNHPLLITMKKVAPALAAGNTVVVKPSELAPVAVLEFARALTDAGIPDGTVNVVTGFGGEAGQALVEHPGLDRIDLTGGTETGRRVAQAAGHSLIPVQAELGGKTPVLVFDDIDAAEAVAGAAFAAFVASGQSCIAGTRLLVHRGIAGPVREGLVARCETIRVGDPMEERTQMGPVASRRQLERVLSLVESAVADGAVCLHGGQRLEVPGAEGGYYIRPTVLAGVTSTMRIMHEEVFGPVVTLEVFGDEAEAIDLANRGDYGLGAAVWTNDLRRAHTVAHRLRAGTVWINDHHRIDPAAPWTGFKDSGIGFENGVAAVADYTVPQSLIVNLSRQRFDWFGDDRRDLRYS